MNENEKNMDVNELIEKGKNGSLSDSDFEDALDEEFGDNTFPLFDITFSVKFFLTKKFSLTLVS